MRTPRNRETNQKTRAHPFHTLVDRLSLQPGPRRLMGPSAPLTLPIVDPHGAGWALTERRTADGLTIRNSDQVRVHEKVAWARGGGRGSE